MAGYGKKDSYPSIVEMFCYPHVDPAEKTIEVREWFKVRPRQSLDDGGEFLHNRTHDGTILENDDGSIEGNASAIIRGYGYKYEMDNVLNGIHNWDMTRHLETETSRTISGG